jgi:Tfp pilus assembly protein PilO
MPKSFNLAGMSLEGISVKDPRIVMRVVAGLLLAANLAAAVMAFHPFGGGADDLRRQQESLTAQLGQLQARLKAGQELVEKVKTARTEGDEFVNKYFMNSQAEGYMILDELNKSEQDAGIKVRQESFSWEEIEGSNSLHMLSTQVGLEGSYANLTKFVNLLDKSDRFLIIEYMQASAPQQQQQAPMRGPKVPPDQSLTVTLKIDAFIKDTPGAGL